MGVNGKEETQGQERLIFTGELGLVQGIWTCRVCVCVELGWRQAAGDEAGQVHGVWLLS